ncbi:MAG: hypothetical protein ABIJ41_02835 [Candidatus Omnitrophota bacterium]
MTLNTLRNQKGQGLILTVIAATVIFLGLSGAQFLKSIGEKISVGHDDNSMKALYAAERGLEYVIEELKNSSPDSDNWVTHFVDINTEQLIHYSEVTGAQAPVIVLEDLNELTEEGYASQEDQPIQFVAKIYNDAIPCATYDCVDTKNKIVLIKGISGNKERLLAARVSTGSLYDYFMFYPEAGINFDGVTVYDAAGGRIHSNENITFVGGTQIKNISQLSTAKYFKQKMDNFYFTPMVDLDAVPAAAGSISCARDGWTGMCVDENNKTVADNYFTREPHVSYKTWAELYGIDRSDGTTNWRTGACSASWLDPDDCMFDVNASDPRLKYYDPNKWINEYNGYLSGDRGGLLCEKGTTGTFAGCRDKIGVVEDGYTWRPLDPILYPEKYMYNTPTGSNLYDPALITPYDPDTPTTVKIPNRLDTEWRWPRYAQDGIMGRKTYTDNYTKAYSFFPPNDYNPDDIQTTCTDERFCPEVKFLNTEYQADDWAEFLETTEGGVLQGVLLDSSTGATSIASPIVSAKRLRNMAKDEGILIENTVDRASFNSSGNFEGRHFQKLYYLKENLLDSTGGTVGNYKVKITGETEIFERVPDEYGEIKVTIDVDGSPADVVIFKKEGFYNTMSSLWHSLVLVDIENLNKAIGQGVIPAPKENVAYSDWDVGLSHAQELMDGGLTVVTEGNAYAIGSINTENYVPASVIAREKFFPLSRDFDFPKEIPELGNHPDIFYIDDPDTEENEEEPVHSAWRNAHKEGTADPMPNRVMQDEVYRISIIGDNAADLGNFFYNTTLELWNWKNDWEDKNEDYKHYGKTFTGTLFKLPNSLFQDDPSDPTDPMEFYDYGWLLSDYNRSCTQEECLNGPDTQGFYQHYDTYYFLDFYWKSCRGCSEYCNEVNDWCGGGAVGKFPFDIGSIPSEFKWESDYLTGSLPPADLPGVSITGWALLKNTDVNFNKYCKMLSVH